MGRKENIFVGLLLLVSLFLIGCGNSAEPTAAPTVANTEVAVVNTATAIPPSKTPASTNTPFVPPTEIVAPATFTPVPTKTPLPATNTPTNTPTPEFTPTPTYTPTPTSTVGPTPGPRPPSRPSVNASPGNPQPYLSRYQLVTYYGSPWGRGLGILGNQPLNETLRLLWANVHELQDLDSRFAMPTYHMITTVANQNPPEYRHLVDLATINLFINHANNNEAAAILDVQPGRMDIKTEFERIRYALYNPHVHFAIDPEFHMNDEQIPNVHVGQTMAEDINWVQAQMNQIALEIGVNRVLILHQFKGSMLPDKALIQNYPHVELVIDSDGTFNTDIKVFNYLQYANEPGFEYGGIKIFYAYDPHIMTAEEIMRLNPRPAVIIYQ